MIGKLWLLAVITVAVAREFTDGEIARARACLRISMAFNERHPSSVSDLIASKPHLNPKNLENKLLVDVFEDCRKSISASDVEHVKTSRGQFNWDRLGKYLAYDPSAYTSESDLAISDEHLQIRKVLMNVEKREQL